MRKIKAIVVSLLIVSLILPYSDVGRGKAGFIGTGMTKTEAAEKQISDGEISEGQAEWNIKSIHAENSYEESKNLKRIKVAVLDSGLDYDEDIPYVCREDFLGEKELHTLYQDYTGHGTSVAGLICAKGNDSRITGIAANVDLYAARILDEKNEAPVSRVVKAVQWAMEQKVNIIHMSFGTKEYSQELYDVIKQAYNKNILIIASAGNTGTAQEDESTVEYPAAFPDVIAVGATNTQNKKTEISASGEELDIVAPGDQILTAGSFGGVMVEEGTSMAAAQITGIAAVLWGRYPDKSNQFIRELLVNSANSTAVTGDCGNGIADYEKAKDNYSGMNLSYQKLRRAGRSDRYAAKSAGAGLARNTERVEIPRKVNYVNGAWHEKKHRSFVKDISDDKIKIVKKGAVAPDKVPKMQSYKKHPCFHGGGNYLANTQYLYALAREYFNAKKNKTVKLPTYQKVFHNVNPYKSAEKPQKIRETLTVKTRNALFKHCLGNNKKKWTNKNKAYVMLGVALHNATDAFSHRGYRNIGSEEKPDWWRIIHKIKDVTGGETRWGSVGYLWKKVLHYGEKYDKLAIADSPKQIKMLSRLSEEVSKWIIKSFKSKADTECYNCFDVAFSNYNLKGSDKEFKMENVDKYWAKMMKLSNGEVKTFNINIDKADYTVKFCSKEKLKTEVKKGKVSVTMPYYNKQSYLIWFRGKKKPVYFKKGEIKGGKITFIISKKEMKNVKVKETQRIRVSLVNRTTAETKTYQLRAKCTISFDKGNDKKIKGSMKKKTIQYEGNKKFTIKNKFRCKGKKFAGWRVGKKKKIYKKGIIPFIKSGKIILNPVFKKEKKV